MDQMTWDNILCNAWKRDMPMDLVFAHFVDRRGHAPEGLLRLPLRDFNKVTARRFIAAHLPKLSEILWSDGVASALIHLIDSKEDTLAVACDAHKAKKDKYDRDATRRQVRRAVMKTTVFLDAKDAMNRSNQWGVCK